MKIGLAIHHYSPGFGGPFTVISETANYLYKNNLNCRIYYGASQYCKANLNLEEIVKSRDIFHMFGIWSPFHVRLYYYVKKFNKKIIISTLGATEPWALNQKKLKKKIAWKIYQKKILDNCDYIHATSDLEKEHLLDLGIKAPIKLIPHGVIKKDKKKLEITKNNKKEALFFSRIHKKKGILELLNSWSIINPKDWILKIYGPVSDINYLREIKKKINNLSLQDNVKIYEPVFDNEKKEKIFLNSDCFLLPSKSENFGMSIVEALSYGIPILTTEGTPWKVLKSINAGKIINFSQENLTVSLREMLNMSEQELIKMGLNGRNYLLENFDMEIIIKKYVKFYEEVLSKC